jgi:hypothetical protein
MLCRISLHFKNSKLCNSTISILTSPARFRSSTTFTVDQILTEYLKQKRTRMRRAYKITARKNHLGRFPAQPARTPAGPRVVVLDYERRRASAEDGCWLACAKTETAACCKMFELAISALSWATSVSRKREFAADKFSY